MIGQVALGTLGFGLWGARSVLVLTLLGGGGSTPEPQPTVTPTSTPTTSASAMYVNPNETEQEDDESSHSPSPRPSSANPKPKRTTSPPSEPKEEPAEVYYPSCSAARAAGAAPLYAGDPGYRLGLDRNKDGVACE